MTYCSVNGIDMHYEIYGKGQPLVFIHGLGSSVRDWEWQIPYFSRHYQVIVFDVRGHGKTSKPPGPYSVSGFAKDTAQFIRKLGFESVHVAGLSMGGMIAFQLAIDSPDIVKSLTIINSGPELILQRVFERLMFFQRKAIVHMFGTKTMGRILAGRLFPKPSQKKLRRNLIMRWGENDKTAYINSLNAIIGWSVRPQIHHITCPVFIISADKDYTSVEYKKTYAAQMSNADIAVISDSCHMSAMDQPKAFNQTLMNFLCSS